MRSIITGVAFRVLGYGPLLLPPIIVDARSLLQRSRFQHSRWMENNRQPAGNPTYVTSPQSNRSSGGRGRGNKTNVNRQRSRGNCSSSFGYDIIDALGKLLEAVRHDTKQWFGLLEENGELLIRANQGHSLVTVETESLLKPILSTEEVPVCVHGTDKTNLESILREGLMRMQRLHVHFTSGLPTNFEVVSGMRRDVDMLIYLDVRKALEEGMKLYVSDNKVILTEGFNGVVPVKYFQKIESWPQRQPIPFSNSNLKT
ncbi:hypothetical protein OROMI_018497 [Orobanche minor]